MPEVVLTGLDGGNLLGFLAALGTFRILSGIQTARMSWTEASWWTPVIHSTKSEEDLLTCIGSKLCGAKSINPAWEIAPDLTLPIPAIHSLLIAAADRARLTDRTESDFLCAFGADIFGIGPKKECMSDTEFRTMSGAGHQHFLGFMNELATITNEEDLIRSLFSPWNYQDGRPSLRWDPADFRPHALRAADPSKDPILTMRGANRLAVEALPLFPTAPAKRRLRTVGFEEQSEVGITWPIWTEPLDLDTVKSLLALEEVQSFNEENLAARGIAQVFRAQRFTEGKYRNFSPATALM